MFETVISAIIDEFPRVLRKNRVIFTFVCHLVGFVCGLPMVTYGGMWVLTLMVTYSASYGLMFTCLCELIAINYIYGNSRFCDDIELMLGFRPNLYWKATWMVITPLAILVLLIVSIYQYEPIEYGDYQFETWVEGIGFVMVGLPIVTIILVAIIKVIQLGGIRAAMAPDPQWGPAKKEHRTGKYAVDTATEMERIESGDIKSSARSEGIDNPAASTTSISMINAGADKNVSSSYRL
ncbi:transporter [Elysia marginata]|uniref:Transporter n=1 Tax=Elysia marginata TaxID=1093978 RepID=A0AAV4IPC8_9GAST|nr:transporter [Elysia marginata]